MQESGRRSSLDKEKKEYLAPKLTAYGTVAKLTQGNASRTTSDGGSGMFMA